jgi:hypothetical protein
MANVEDSQSARLPFNNLQKARLSLNEIFVQYFQPMSLLEVANRPSVGVNLAKKGEKEIHTEQLHHWNSRLGLWVIDSLRKLSAEDIKGSHALHVLSIIAIIWNTYTEEPKETAYDAHFESHKGVINLALAFIQENTTSSPVPTAALSSESASRSTTPNKRILLGKFTFEMGIIRRYTSRLSNAEVIHCDAKQSKC